jgi:methylmalonyl-CoA mutase N-terminal domain/subunit
MPIEKPFGNAVAEQSTRSGIPLRSHYTPDDLRDLDYERQLGAPGAYPYTRGRRDSVGSWMQRGLSGEGDPVRSNRQLKYLLAQGQIGVDVVGDSPTQCGLDPDHPLAAPAVGTQGVSMCCLQDYRQLLDGIPLDSVVISSSLPPGQMVSALYLLAQEQGIPLDKLRGSSVQAPYYGEDCSYASHMPFRLRLKGSADIIEFCTREMPRFHTFLEDTYFIAEVGLTPAEEMALGFVEIRGLVRELLERGLPIDSFAPRIAILVNCGMDFLEEIAKMRATRRLFARMMREEFGAQDPRSLKTVIACHSSGLSLTAQQPVNNVVRGTVQAMAAVLGGAQAVEISAFDEAFRTPSPESHRVALRTQQILHLESDIAKVVDPLGGSYFMESLTDELEKRIWDMVVDIESRGDPAELSDGGWFKAFFHDAATRYASGLEDGTLQKVGLNCHQIPDSEDVLLRDISERKIEPYGERIEQITAYKKSRDPVRLRDALQEVQDKARQRTENTLYTTIKAMQAGATMGEIGGMVRLANDLPYDPYGMVEAPL